MKVLIMSDSHGLTHEINLIKERHRDEVEAMIHCGDSELPMTTTEMEGFLAVRGNCDYDKTYPDERFEEINGLRFFITHGHLYNVKMTLMNLGYKSEESNAKIVCFGHSHIAGSELVDDKIFINPGSIRQPRGTHDKTYTILEDVAGETKVTFFDLEGNEIKSLTQTYHLQ
ncbi:metallophosphoesterase [Peribacillus cavernae]|uniref:Phosphoesterase n=1 Tax=Peribacillus cavernae TaxID=1674310 RepID=A0A433H7A8_9BACI|nr:metallophosphoesterase [Peribacillus cavernae]MDQ0220142.1 putative phosphoesterase [Peribacillus cavernae]RUQ24201.1 metallophosphoesterase [Peribacillus cavernae]